jgi:hypothetical protein
MRQLQTSLFLLLTLSSHELAAQPSPSRLGWVERTMTVSVQKQGNLRQAALEATIAQQAAIRNDAEAFRIKFSGLQQIILTNALLTEVANTQQTTEGLHLFMGLEGGRFVPMLVHTDLVTSAANVYQAQADFSRAYFGQANGQWQLVQQSAPGLLKAQIRTATQALSYSRIKGYYLAKDVLLDAWNRNGKQPLTIYFLLDASEVHLLIPFVSQKAIINAIRQRSPRQRPGFVDLPVSLFFTNAAYGAMGAVARKAGDAMLKPDKAHEIGPGTTTENPGGGVVYKIHGSIRCCPSYCGGLNDD